MTKRSYKLSFTTGGLLLNESLSAVDLYRQYNDWDLVHQTILSENILRSRTYSSSVRKSRELIQRMQILTETQLLLLGEGSQTEQRQILWLAVCKQYDFVREFAVEVIRDKFQKLNLEIIHLDFDIFFISKAEWHPDLEELTITTRAKLRQVLFRMMREAGILSRENKILPTLLTHEVAREILGDNPEYLQIFPINESEIRRLESIG